MSVRTPRWSSRLVARRQFLLTLGAGLAGSVGVLACAPTPPPAAQPTAAPKAPAAAPPTSPPAAAAAPKPTTAPAPTAAAAANPTTAPAAKAAGGVLTTAIEADPITIDPAFTSGLPGRRTGRAVFDALIDLDQQGQPIPALAERWETPDPKTYVLHLRKGVKFHDGTDFNAEAVKFHFDRHLNPDTKSLRRGELAQVEEVAIQDSHAVKITLKAPFAPFLYALFDWSAFIASPTAVQKLGQEFGVKPVGTGPFRFVEYAKDQHTIVERNPDYWDAGKPSLDRIVFRPIPVDSTRLTELRSGGVQIAEDLPYQDVQRMRAMSEIVLSEKNGFRFEFLAFQTQKQPYGANRAFRQALNWALDREAIHAGVYFGTGSIGYDPFLPGTAFHDPNYQPFTRDVAKAKQLLDSAGLPSPLEFTLYVGPDPVVQKKAQIIQANYGEVGVGVKIEPEDSSASTERMLGSNFDLYVGRWWGYRPDPDLYLTTLVHSTGSNNYSKYANPETDRILDEARSEASLEKRVALYRRLAPILSEDAANIYYHYGANFKGLSPAVRGFVHMQDGIVRYRDISLS
jgi:peptide/nickel transport system substrate-binding protein